MDIKPFGYTLRRAFFIPLQMAIQQHIIEQLLLPNGGKYAVHTIADAYTFCKSISTSHYENFPVGSVLVGKERVHHFHAVYAFARLADDIADELQLSHATKIEYLTSLKSQLSETTSTHPIFVALNNTRQKLNIPYSPFEMLLQAFIMDSDFKQPETWDDVLFYCKHSANPVGEIVLRIFGECNNQTIGYSDAICTALQLTNFWQDFSRDLPNNRRYIPKSVLRNHKLPETFLDSVDFYAKFPVETQNILHEIYQYTAELFRQGSRLIDVVSSIRLKAELAATLAGGTLILNKSKKSGLSIFSIRPSLSPLHSIQLLVRTLTYYSKGHNTKL